MAKEDNEAKFQTRVKKAKQEENVKVGDGTVPRDMNAE